MKKFIITEEEKSRILGMHKSAIAREFLGEQGTPAAAPAAAPATPAPAAAAPTTTAQTTVKPVKPEQQKSNIVVDFKRGDSLGSYAFLASQGLQIVLKPENNKYVIEFTGKNFTGEDRVEINQVGLRTFIKENITKFVAQGVMIQDPITGKQVPVTAYYAADIAKAIYNKIKNDNPTLFA